MHKMSHELREGSVSYAICIPVGDAQWSGQIVNICGQLDIISDTCYSYVSLL
jgi:hypothetical protein